MRTGRLYQNQSSPNPHMKIVDAPELPLPDQMNPNADFVNYSAQPFYQQPTNFQHQSKNPMVPDYPAQGNYSQPMIFQAVTIPQQQSNIQTIPMHQKQPDAPVANFSSAIPQQNLPHPHQMVPMRQKHPDAPVANFPLNIPVDDTQVIQEDVNPHELNKKFKRTRFWKVQKETGLLYANFRKQIGAFTPFFVLACVFTPVSVILWIVALLFLCLGWVLPTYAAKMSVAVGGGGFVCVIALGR